MAWKPKEKPLSAEEAIALARKELAPRWLGSPPLIAAIKNGDTVTAHPLDASISGGTWLLLFVDPLEMGSERAFEMLREWHHRYTPHGLGFIAMLNPAYEFIRESAFLQTYSEGKNFPYPVAIDADSMLAVAFRVSQRPHATLLVHGKSLHEASGPGWEQGLELAVQEQLRRKDPGLPLPPCVEIKDIGAEAKLELGAVHGVRVTGNAQGAISIKKSVPSHFKAGEFFITGEWTQLPERIETRDPAAAIGFHSPKGSVSLVARSLATTAEQGTIVIELGGIPAYDRFCAKEVEFGEDGQSVIRVGKPKMYHMLRELPERERDVILRFPMATRCPVAIYGLRFSD